MAATITWVPGTLYGTTWTAVFGTEANSLPSFDAILSSVAIDNSIAGDTHMDVSFAISSFATASSASLGLSWYTLNQDGTTYGDGRFATAAAGPVLGSYFLGQAALIPSVTQAQEGNFTPMLFVAPKLLLPPGKGKLVLYNNNTAALGSTVTVKAQSYKLQVA